MHLSHALATEHAFVVDSELERLAGVPRVQLKLLVPVRLKGVLRTMRVALVIPMRLKCVFPAGMHDTALSKETCTDLVYLLQAGRVTYEHVECLWRRLRHDW